MTPSPQCGLVAETRWQSWPGILHRKPGSTVLQSGEQPSPLRVLPSSQTSPATVTSPSPQCPVETHRYSGTSQRKPTSTWQRSEQPSPLWALPSSQPSPGSTWQLPHGRQGVPTSGQLHPVSTKQRELQPSPELTLP